MAALLLFFVLADGEGSDFVIFLINLLVVPLASLVLIAIVAIRIHALPRKRRQSLSFVAMVAAFWAVSWTACLNYGLLHTTSCWILRSKMYKAQVLSQPLVGTGNFRHIEWDGWGMVGSETMVYLVSDPSDRLVRIDSKHIRIKPSGKPCEVWHVRRMEKGWYSATFYTNSGWEDCEEGTGR